jgi:hypothetical protein
VKLLRWAGYILVFLTTLFLCLLMDPQNCHGPMKANGSAPCAHPFVADSELYLLPLSHWPLRPAKGSDTGSRNWRRDLSAVVLACCGGACYEATSGRDTIADDRTLGSRGGGRLSTRAWVL